MIRCKTCNLKIIQSPARHHLNSKTLTSRDLLLPVTFLAAILNTEKSLGTRSSASQRLFGRKKGDFGGTSFASFSFSGLFIRVNFQSLCYWESLSTGDWQQRSLVSFSVNLGWAIQDGAGRSRCHLGLPNLETLVTRLLLSVISR